MQNSKIEAPCSWNSVLFHNCRPVICVVCSSFRIVVQLRRHSPPPDARNAILFLSGWARYVPLRCSQDDVKCRRPRLFFFALHWQSFYSQIFFPPGCFSFLCCSIFNAWRLGVFFFYLCIYVGQISVLILCVIIGSWVIPTTDSKRYLWL